VPKTLGNANSFESLKNVMFFMKNRKRFRSRGKKTVQEVRSRIVPGKNTEEPKGL
jgi:hypothetical protein